jgi:hypothetical protein
MIVGNFGLFCVKCLFNYIWQRTVGNGIILFVLGFRNCLLYCFLPPPLSNLHPPFTFGSSPFTSLFSQREVLRRMLREKNGFAIQSIQEQATSFTFFKFSVENKIFPTLMTLNKCSLKVYPSFSDERLEG